MRRALVERAQGGDDVAFSELVDLDGGGEFYGYSAGDTDEYWILDVEGTRVAAIAFRSRTASPELVAERRRIFDSVVITP